MPAQPRLILRYRQSDTVWENLPLREGEFVLGRASDCDLRLDHPGVALYHARLSLASEGLWLTDLGSINGT